MHPIGSGRNEVRRSAARWLANPLFAPARRNPEVARRLEEMAGDYACGHWAGRRIATRWLVRDPASQLGELHVPTLVVDGELDTPRFRAMASEYARLLPNARRVTIPDAGHVCNLEAPDAFNGIVRRFVGSMPT